MNFSEAVKTAMSKSKLKPSELARQTGYSAQHIYDLLSGDRRWNEDSINKVCEALELKIEIRSEEAEVSQ